MARNGRAPTAAGKGNLNHTARVAAGVLPDDFAAATPSRDAQVITFCGACQHFEDHALGDGGECRRGHDPQERTRARHCPDRTLLPVSKGPLFDMSE